MPPVEPRNVREKHPRQFAHPAICPPCPPPAPARFDPKSAPASPRAKRSPEPASASGLERRGARPRRSRRPAPPRRSWARTSSPSALDGTARVRRERACPGRGSRRVRPRRARRDRGGVVGGQIGPRARDQASRAVPTPGVPFDAAPRTRWPSAAAARPRRAAERPRGAAMTRHVIIFHNPACPGGNSAQARPATCWRSSAPRASSRSWWST